MGLLSGMSDFLGNLTETVSCVCQVQRELQGQACLGSSLSATVSSTTTPVKAIKLSEFQCDHFQNGETITPPAWGCSPEEMRRCLEKEHKDCLQGALNNALFLFPF